MESMEDLEDPTLVGSRYADAVVPNAVDRAIRRCLARNMDLALP
jgi:hypothetical protein